MVLMRRHGVSYLKSIEIEISMGELNDKKTLAPIPEVVQEQKGPQTAASAPPVEVEIPHHVNEVSNLLKLSDEELVDKLFPEGAPPNA